MHLPDIVPEILCCCSTSTSKGEMGMSVQFIHKGLPKRGMFDEYFAAVFPSCIQFETTYQEMLPEIHELYLSFTSSSIILLAPYSDVFVVT